MIKKRIKRVYYYLFNSILVLFFSLLLFSVYSKHTTLKINLISEEYFQKLVYNSLDLMVYEVINDYDIEQVLEINKNSEGEILYVDYNLNKTYLLLKEVSKSIKSRLTKDSPGGITYKVPFLIGSNNVFLSNLGPKITIKIDYINSILANVYTKITNYGLNNALVEAYIKVTIEGKILTPVSENRKIVNYDLLISSTVINGRIPEFYGNYLTSNSSIFDVPINE